MGGSFKPPVAEIFWLGNLIVFPFGRKIEMLAVAFFVKWETDNSDGLFSFKRVKVVEVL